MLRSCFLGAVVVGAMSGAAVATLPVGTYTLLNHPDGSADPPPYGLRLDELYNATSGHDIFTFDFNHPSSNMTLTYTGTTVTISGNTYGGRDTGATYAADAYLGVYTVSFTYNLGVGLAPGDDDVWANPIPDGVNLGSIITPLGDTIALRDKSDGNYAFRLGDEDNDAGHRGFAGTSGWGWLTHGPANAPHVAASDWIFVVGPLVPAPGAGAMLVLGGMLAARRRRA